MTEFCSYSIVESRLVVIPGGKPVNFYTSRICQNIALYFWINHDSKEYHLFARCPRHGLERPTTSVEISEDLYKCCQVMLG
jgi:hypothetical protein